MPPMDESLADDEGPFEELTGAYDAFFDDPPAAVVGAGEKEEAASSVPDAQAPAQAGGGVELFAMYSDGSDAESGEQPPPHDLGLPEVPEPPRQFTEEDRRLREALLEFYLRYRAENVSKVHGLVQVYRGRAVSHLWAQLAVKYQLEAVEAVDLLARTLYLSGLFECIDEDNAEQMEERLRALTTDGSPEQGLNATEARRRLLRAILQDSATEAHPAGAAGAASVGLAGAASVGLAQALCFRGLPEGCERERPLVWQLLLGSLPWDRRAEWRELREGRRALYEERRQRFLASPPAGGGAGGGGGAGHHHGMQRLEVRLCQEARPLAASVELLRQIEQDAERARQGLGLPSASTAACTPLVALLFTYAQLHPRVPYVQGVSQVATVLWHVMSAAEPSSLAESDAFWCLDAVMGRMRAATPPGAPPRPAAEEEDVYATVGLVERLLHTYDPELARHLSRHGSPQFVQVFRWCDAWFAQDLELPQLLLLWDAIISDPASSGWGRGDGCEFLAHFCLAMLLTCRRDLLIIADDEIGLAEALLGSPRRVDFEAVLRRAWAICAFERRPQTPVFPARSARQVVDQLSQWAQTATSRAQGLTAEVRRKIQERVAAAAAAGADGASRATAPAPAALAAGAAAAAVDQAASAATTARAATQAWLQETVPAGRESLEGAQRRFASLLRATSTVAAAAAQRVVDNI